MTGCVKNTEEIRGNVYFVILISVHLVMADDTLADVMKGGKQKHLLI